MTNGVRLRPNVAGKAGIAVAVTAVLAAPVIVDAMTAPFRAQPSPQTSGQSTAATQAKEAVLKRALFEMRDAIDHYYADKKTYPRRLASLVREGYITTIPTDPFSNAKSSWQTVPAKPDPKHQTAARGFYDVKSRSKGTALDGTKYSDW
jgi:general secretion pathway protein G